MKSARIPLVVLASFLFILAALSYVGSKPNSSELERRSQELARRIKLEEPEKQHALIMAELENSSWESYKSGVLRDVAIALFVALTLLLTVEFYVRETQRKDLQHQIHEFTESTRHQIQEITASTWEAVGRRLLGSKIAQEVDQILKVDAAKEQSQYNFTFDRIEEIEGVRWAIVILENRFTLRNLAVCGGGEFAIRPNIVSPRELKDYPQFVSVEVDGKTIPQEKMKIVEGKSLSYTLTLPKEEEKICVKIVLRMAYHLSDSETFITTRTPIENLGVAVDNRIPDVIDRYTLEVMSPHYSKLEEISKNNWRFERALLPGQGFALVWREKTSPHTKLT